jgi:squalene-hopene/tetraprenyl-beta-curcumene cyclase
MRMRSSIPFPIPLLGILLLAALVLLPSCGDDADEPKGDTPYGADTPYGTQTPYGAGAGTGPGTGLSADLRKEVEAALAKGRALLLSMQEENGSWGDASIGWPADAGFTAMAVTAVISATPAMDVGSDAAIRKALDFLVAQQKDDGSVYDNDAYVTYQTSAATGAFATAKIPAYRENQVKARDYLVQSQIAAGQDDPSYGGFPYKQHQGQPADLSNVQFALTALADAGLPQDHVVWQRAQAYLARVQNRSESNDYVTEVEIDGEKRTVKSGDSGGGIYHPGNSKAGYIKRNDGTYEPASYGSMTYALLKCLILAGVDAKDPRVLAAMGWLTRNFTLERNPGFEAAVDPEQAGQQGFYYYLFTMARTLGEYEALTKEALVVTDAEGAKHNWRAELARKLLDRRGEDGWWTNPVDRWAEASRVLVTSYALQALAEVSGRHR